MPSSIRRRRHPLAAALGALIALALASLAPAMASSGTVFPPDARPFGLSYGQWSALWWQQALLVPRVPGSPFESGRVNCALLGTPQVVFLVGTSSAQPSGAVERSCRVPANKAILFPPINGECSDIEDPTLRTEGALRACANAQADLMQDITAWVDGVAIPVGPAFRSDSPLFRFIAAPNNYFSPGIPGLRLARAVADGYWVMLTPVAPGVHTVSFGGAVPAFGFTTHTTYRLTVTN